MDLGQYADHLWQCWSMSRRGFSSTFWWLFLQTRDFCYFRVFLIISSFKFQKHKKVMDIPKTLKNAFIVWLNICLLFSLQLGMVQSLYQCRCVLFFLTFIAYACVYWVLMGPLGLFVRKTCEKGLGFFPPFGQLFHEF